jgi:predicted adenylyl cyclase CyaB
MFVEIEAKLKVESFEPIEKRLVECGASLSSQTVQTDAYFDTDDRSMTRSDQALRLRRQSDGCRERIILTYKGTKETSDFKKREEVNLEVHDAAAVERLLGGLGYRKALAFNKKRQTWLLNDCEVALDTLPLIGAFVEIEGPDSTCIARVQDRLHLARVPHVKESYACLIQAELARRGTEQAEVYL